MWLRNMANLPSERTNANFLIALMDPFGELTRESPKVMHWVEVQANSAESVFELCAQQAGHNDQHPMPVAMWASTHL